MVKHHSRKQYGAVMRQLKKAVKRVNSVASKAARTVEKPVLRLTKKGLGVVLKRRVGGRYHRGGSKVRSLGGNRFSSTAAPFRSVTVKKGGRKHRRKHRTHRRKHRTHRRKHRTHRRKHKSRSRRRR